MHEWKRKRLLAEGRRRASVEGKAIVMGLLERHGDNGSRAHVKVMPTNRQFHVRSTVRDNVEKGSTVYSDSLKSSANLPADGFVHDFVDHTEEGQVHTNGLENFWSLLKRALKGT